MKLSKCGCDLWQCQCAYCTVQELSVRAFTTSVRYYTYYSLTGVFSRTPQSLPEGTYLPLLRSSLFALPLPLSLSPRPTYSAVAYYKNLPFFLLIPYTYNYSSNLKLVYPTLPCPTPPSHAAHTSPLIKREGTLPYLLLPTT